MLVDMTSRPGSSLDPRRATRLDVIRDLHTLVTNDYADLVEEVRRAVLVDRTPIAQVARAAGMSRQHVYDLRARWAAQSLSS